jgi:hypothetical protein
MNTMWTLSLFLPQVPMSIADLISSDSKEFAALRWRDILKATEERITHSGRSSTFMTADLRAKKGRYEGFGEI